MKCPKCGSENISIQVVEETHSKKKHHGIVYWLCFGWLIDLMSWVFLTLPRLIIAIFRPKKYKTVSVTKSVCVCQNCGYHWEQEPEKIKE